MAGCIRHLITKQQGYLLDIQAAYVTNLLAGIPRDYPYAVPIRLIGMDLNKITPDFHQCIYRPFPMFLVREIEHQGGRVKILPALKKKKLDTWLLLVNDELLGSIEAITSGQKHKHINEQRARRLTGKAIHTKFNGVRSSTVLANLIRDYHGRYRR